MLLSHKKRQQNVPFTTSCVIKTKGDIKHKGIVEIVSPLFPSINCSMKTVNLKETLSVPIILNKPEKVINGTGDIIAELCCSDGDIIHMYVTYDNE